MNNICPDCTLHISKCQCYKLRCDDCNHLKAAHGIKLDNDGNVVDVCPTAELDSDIKFEPNDGWPLYYTTGKEEL